MCSSVCLLLLVILTVTGAFWSVKAEFCPPQKKTDETKFTIELGSKDYVRLFHSIAIPCCAEGYQSISWYKNENGTWRSFPPPSQFHDYNHPEVQENGQILRFYSPNLTDEASYRCYVKGKSTVIQHTTDLAVVACDPMARGPIQTAPFPQNQTIYQYGGNITIPCTGYFGCSDEGDRALDLVLWRVEEMINSTVEEISPRYSVHEWKSINDFTKQHDLTIKSVQAEDVQRTFICVLASPQEIHRETITKVKIFKKDKPESPALLIGLITGGCVLFVIVLIIVGLILHCMYGPQIRLYLSSRISRLGPKTIDNETYSYNLFIYHAEDDETKAQEIKAYLLDHNYKVFITADIQGNLNKMHTFFEKTAKSAMVLFLYSDALKNDELANFFLQSLITERKGKDIMFLQAADYKPEDIMDWTRHAKNVNELQEGNLGKNQREEINNGRSIEENDGIDGEVNDKHKKEVAIEKKDELANDLHYWKVLPRIKLPQDDKNERIMENFWCSLRNAIPKFEEQKQKSRLKRHNKQRNSSSRKPLLESTGDNEAASPLSLASNTGEFSPNSNEVFRFEDSNEVVQQRTQENRNQNLAGSEKETILVLAGHNPENDPLAFHTANRQMAQNENGIVRGETNTGEDNEFLYAADVHHNESSEVQANANEYHDYSANIQMNRSDDESEARGQTEVKSKEDIFTMSDEELKTKSSDSESGYSGMNRSGRGTAYPSSESGDSSHHGGLSSQSSGFSDFISEGSVSPPNVQGIHLDHANVRGQTNQKLPYSAIGAACNSAVKPNGHIDIENTELIGSNKKGSLVPKGQSSRNQSFGSPESGYNTSPSERILSNGAFLPEIKENLERDVDSVAENK